MVFVFGGVALLELILALVLYFTLRRPANLIVAGVLAFQAAIFGALAAWFAWRFVRKSSIAADPPPTLTSATDPLTAALGAAWHDRARPPSVGKLRELVRLHPAEDPDRARIVALGPVDVPTVGELHFEPEIVTPLRYFGRNMILAGIGVFFVLLAVAKWSRVFPWLEPIPLTSFAYFYAMLGIFAVTWLYRAAIRPTYIRLAPGIVEILRFKMRGGPPDIHSYPMTGETTIILYATWWSRPRKSRRPQTSLAFGETTETPRRPYLAVLIRGEQLDKIVFQQIRGAEEIIDRFWLAALSTAPTPPLSRDELVG